MYQDPNEIIIPRRSISTHPMYLSPTIEEIESLTLDSELQHDMANHVIDNVYTCTLWDNFQQDLYNARKLERIAREHCQRAALQWERFRMNRFNVRMAGVIKRERGVKRRLDKEGSQFKGLPAPPLIVRNPTPAQQMIHPRY